MERYNETIGLPVICLETGKKAGVVSDIIFCPKSREVKALVLERQGHQVYKKSLLLKDIVDSSKDAVIINNDACLSDYRKMAASRDLLGKGKVKGLHVYSKNGHDLGIVKDVLFDFKRGHLEGVEISDGLFQDIIQGRNILPLLGKVEFSEENMLVDQEAEEEMINSDKGLKNILSDR